MKRLLWLPCMVMLLMLSMHGFGQLATSMPTDHELPGTLPNKDLVKTNGFTKSQISRGDTLFFDNFSGGLDSWIQSDAGKGSFSAYNANQAGGEAPELLFYPSWGKDFGSEITLASPVFSTKGNEKIALMYKIKCAITSNFSMEIRTTSDGGTTWNLAYTRNFTKGESTKGIQYVPVTTSDVGSENFQFMIACIGKASDFSTSYFFIDDLLAFKPKSNEVQLTGLASYNKMVAGTEIAPKVGVKNNGLEKSAIDVTMVAYTKNDEVVYSATVRDTLNGFISKDITLPEIKDLDSATYKLTLKVDLIGADDENTENNQVSSTLKVVDFSNKVYAYVSAANAPLTTGTAIVNGETGDVYPFGQSKMSTADLFAGADFLPGQKWISCASNGLYEINTINGKSTKVLSLSKRYDGIAYSYKNGCLYANNKSGLVKINLNTGEVTPVGSYKASTAMMALAVNKDNKLYGVDKVNLYSINIESGEATIIGAHGYTLYYENSLFFDANREKLFLFGYSYNGSYAYPLAMLNLETGASTLVANSAAIIIGGATESAIAPKELGYANGLVKNNEGDAIENARIVIENQNGYSSSALTNANGEYQFKNYIPAGDYSLYAFAKYYQATEKSTITIAKDAPVNKDFSLQLSPYNVTLTIVNDEAKNLDSVTVIFYGDTIMTGTGNVAEFKNIPAGKYTASLSRKGYYNGTSEIEVSNASVSKELVMELNVDVERRLVLVEDITGTWCVNCPAASNGLDELQAKGYPVAAVAYHGNDAWQIKGSVERINYYAVTGFPTVMIDGVEKVVGGSSTGSMFSYYKPFVEARMAKKTSVDVIISDSSFNAETRVVTIKGKVKAIGNVASENNSLHFAITESHIKTVWFTLNEINEVVRYNNNDGKGQAIALTKGSEENFEFSYTLPEEWDDKFCKMVVFVQNNDTKEVLNADKRDVRKVNYYEVEVEVSDDFTGEKISKGSVLLDEAYSFLFSSNSNAKLTNVVEGEHVITISATGYESMTKNIDVNESGKISIALRSKGFDYLFVEDFEVYTGMELPAGWTKYSPATGNYLYCYTSSNDGQASFFRQNKDNDTLIAITPKIAMAKADSIFVDAQQGSGIPNLRIAYTYNVADFRKATEISELELTADMETYAVDAKGVCNDSAYLVFQFVTGGESFEFFYMDNVIVTGVSSNTNLRSIEVSNGTMSPAYSPDVYNYTVNIEAGSEIPVISAEAYSKYAKVEITQPESLNGNGEVKVTAQDGTVKTYTLSFTTSIGDNNVKAVTIYPNPVSNVLVIEQVNDANSICLYSADGRMVRNIKPMSETMILGVEFLQNGVYTLQISYKDGSIAIGKFIKQ